MSNPNHQKMMIGLLTGASPLFLCRVILMVWQSEDIAKARQAGREVGSLPAHALLTHRLVVRCH